MQRMVSAESNAELREYLQRYTEIISRDSLTPVSFLRVFSVYFRYPMVAFCLGFCALGVFLLPVLSAVQGFFLSFSVACYAAAMGHKGIYLAFFAFGLRVLFTIPCLILLSVQAFNYANLQSCIFSGKEKRARRWPDKSYFILFGICTVALLLGTLLEITLIPHLFERILQKFM